MIDSSNSNSFPDSNSLSDDPILDILGMMPSETDDIVACQDAAAVLAYSAPDIPLNPQLKNRLFETLGLQPPSFDIYALLKLSIQELKAKSEMLSWEPMDRAPGFDMAIWQEDESIRTMACFIKAEKPSLFPSHSHPSEEIILVLEGDLVEANQIYTTGDRIQSAAGTSHQLHTTQGCLLCCIASMDNQFDA